MLPPSYLDQMPDAFVQLWQRVEDEILQDVARRIGKMDAVTPTANWQLWRYQQTEAVRENVVKLLAKYSGKSEATIRRLLKEAATEAMEREDAIYYHYDMEPTPFEESATLSNLLDAGARQTCGTWQNLTATTANTVTGAFERTLDAAWLKVSTGAFDYKPAVKQAVDSLADDMPMVTYPSGHKDSIEVAARRAVLTGVNQTTGKLQVARMDEMGCTIAPTIEDACENADVVMGLRIQRERQQKGLFPSVAEYCDHWEITPQRLGLGKKNALVMHPGPMNRGVEIASSVADCGQSVITQQVESGVAVRMALLYMLTRRENV